MSKQSNSQKQTVNVTVNNRMACCDKPKKKRRSKPKPRPEEPPMDINEFPALNTPALTRPSYAPFPIRNTVYMPSTVQISPEGMQPPIPEYADRRYTNMVRTLEDMQKNVLNEMQNLRQAMNPTIAPRPMPQLSDEMFEVDVAPQRPQVPVVTQEEARTPMASTMRQNDLFEEDAPMRASSPPPVMRTQQVSSSPNRYNITRDDINLRSPSQQNDDNEETRKRFLTEQYKDKEDELRNDYATYKFEVLKIPRGSGRPPTKLDSIINKIVEFERIYGTPFQ